MSGPDSRRVRFRCSINPRAMPREAGAFGYPVDTSHGLSLRGDVSRCQVTSDGGKVACKRVHSREYRQAERSTGDANERRVIWLSH